jgi:hypothetical protein
MSRFSHHLPCRRSLVSFLVADTRIRWIAPPNRALLEADNVWVKPMEALGFRRDLVDAARLIG